MASRALTGVDGGREYLGVLGQQVRLFFLACRRLHRNAGLARYDVEMQVEYHLATGSFVELLDGYTVS